MDTGPYWEPKALVLQHTEPPFPSTLPGHRGWKEGKWHTAARPWGSGESWSTPSLTLCEGNHYHKGAYTLPPREGTELAKGVTWGAVGRREGEGRFPFPALLKHLEQEKTDLRHSPKQPMALCSPPNFPGLLATLNLFQAGTASGNNCSNCRKDIPFPLKSISMSDYLNLPTLRQVGQQVRTPPPSLRRKFKQRLVIYPRLC